MSLRRTHNSRSLPATTFWVRLLALWTRSFEAGRAFRFGGGDWGFLPCGFGGVFKNRLIPRSIRCAVASGLYSSFALMAKPALDSGMRAIVRRMLKKDIRPEDLMSLFIYVRDRCDGRESIREVGDFVAHRTDRTKGLVTRRARDFFVSFRFWVFLDELEWKINPNQLPRYFREVLWSHFRRESDERIRSASGFSKAEVGKRLPLLIRGLRVNSNRTIRLNPFYTWPERRLIEGLSYTFNFAVPAFTGDTLFADFIAVLRSNGLLENSEIPEFMAVRSWAVLFAASFMHNCLIRFEDGHELRLTLRTRSGSPTDTLQVDAIFYVPTFRVHGISAKIGMSTMFSTDIAAKDGCAEELLAIRGLWKDFYVELTRDGLLNKLG
jgi:hypothetical protein